MPEHITEYRYVPLEYRANENREDGDALGTITGVVMRYGDIATLPWGTEEFAPGAFIDIAGKKISATSELWSNRMHQRVQPLANTLEGSLRFKDSPTELTTEIDLPDTSAGRDVEMEVKKGLLRGLSIEFRTTKDELNCDTGHRRVTVARLFGWGVVDRPAYPRSKVDRWEGYLDFAERRAHYGDEPTPRVTPPPDPEPDERASLFVNGSKVWEGTRDEGLEILKSLNGGKAAEPEPEPVPVSWRAAI